MDEIVGILRWPMELLFVQGRIWMSTLQTVGNEGTSTQMFGGRRHETLPMQDCEQNNKSSIFRHTLLKIALKKKHFSWYSDQIHHFKFLSLPFQYTPFVLSKNKTTIYQWIQQAFLRCNFKLRLVTASSGSFHVAYHHWLWLECHKQASMKQQWLQCHEQAIWHEAIGKAHFCWCCWCCSQVWKSNRTGWFFLSFSPLFYKVFPSWWYCSPILC